MKETDINDEKWYTVFVLVIWGKTLGQIEKTRQAWNFNFCNFFIITEGGVLLVFCNVIVGLVDNFLSLYLCSQTIGQSDVKVNLTSTMTMTFQILNMFCPLVTTLDDTNNVDRLNIISVTFL